jgi:hypothetical protein
MAQDRYAPDSARLIVAGLSGAAERHVNWHQPTEPEAAAAVAEFAEIIRGRDDGPALLAEVAGLLTGYHEGGLDEPRARAAAHFLTEAGADQELAEQWAGEGRRRNNWPTSQESPAIARDSAERPPARG